MYLRIESIPEKKFVGHRVTMSFADNRTKELWQRFMPRRKELTADLHTDLYCLQEYYDAYNFIHFDPGKTFDKWAAIEVNDFTILPDGMETYTLPGGLYAVFLHKGAAQTAPKTFQYIFNVWIPGSAYDLDNRAHFEILGNKYINNDPDSEEEVWIPIKPKSALGL